MSHSYFTRGELSNSKMNLTVEKIKEITAEKDEKSVKILNASRKDIKHVHDLRLVRIHRVLLLWQLL